MTMIPARPPYTPPAAPATYDGGWLRTQLANIARALKPTTGRLLTAAGTIAATDEVLYCDATGGAFAVLLLPASQVQYLTVTLIRLNSGANAVTLTGTVSGAVNPTLGAQWSAKTIHSDGTRWLLLSSV